MGSLGFSPQAHRDLLEIGDYIAQDSRANARLFVGKLKMQCEKIALAPQAYPLRNELAPGLRMAAMGNYLIFFRLLEQETRIERVLHSARELHALFTQSLNPPTPE